MKFVDEISQDYRMESGWKSTISYTDDKIAYTVDGKTIFMGRSIHAKITGRPDALVLAENWV